jgi:hypothetical protein
VLFLVGEPGALFLVGEPGALFLVGEPGAFLDFFSGVFLATAFFFLALDS